MAPAPAGTSDDLDDDAVLAVLVAELRGHQPDAVVHQALWTSTFRIHRRLASTYRIGRILLAGDAAHIHSPFGGQGMNTGLGDAENLAWKLALVATGKAHDALLNTYQAERMPIAREVLESTSAMTRMIVGQTATARAIRDHVFVPLMNRPLVQRAIWEKSSQLKISYRRGPLANHTWPTSRPRPGDRIPDLDCDRDDGTRTRLHTELRSRFALLVPAGRQRDDFAAAVVRYLGATGVVALTPTRQHRHVMLVRPDGHLAWRGTSPATLGAWLTRMLGHGHAR